MTSQAGKKALSSSRSDSALLSLVGDGMGSTVGNDIALTSDDSCSSLTVCAGGGGSGGEEGNDDDGANKRCRSDEINSAAFMDAIGLGKNSNPDMPFLDCSAADSQLQTDDSSSPLNTSSGTKRHCEDDCEADGEAPKRPKPDSSEKMEDDDNTVSSSSPQRNHVVPEPEPASLGSSASGPELCWIVAGRCFRVALPYQQSRPAVAEAVARFSAGKGRADAAILKELHLQQSVVAAERCSEKDSRGLVAVEKKHEHAENFKHAMKRKRTQENDDDYIPGGF
ncbi:hypothetical protein HPB51_018205 [Rhipicephalus microplus]|uniref:Uncharacterized protein n=1 Tax=Rhipicephalus microplus TaxID=6941 RepID=A0A9J6E2G2_RHIMP|nr:hypothetical protein HPB51_018205 [Rhipicephalus microplus]